MFCDKNAAAKSASIQNAKATLEFEFTGRREGRKADAKKKAGGEIISECFLAIATALGAVL